MQTYVVLFNYSSRGMEDIKGSPDRIKSAGEVIAALGGKEIAIYVTMGRYDAIGIFEAPDDETMAKFVLAGGAQGYVRTETTRAFKADEFQQIVESLP